jgi:hypothetical protein
MLDRKCHWAESGPVASAQLAHIAEVYWKPLNLTPQPQIAGRALAGLQWAGTQIRPITPNRSTCNRKGKNRLVPGVQVRGAFLHWRGSLTAGGDPSMRWGASERVVSKPFS